jgi:zinc protease
MNVATYLPQLRQAVTRAAMIASLMTASAAAQPVVPTAAAPPRPAIGPERPFAPPARDERTLPNGLRLVVARYATVPKVSLALTFGSGLSSDPADKAGLAQVVADAVQEGTSTRESRQLRTEVFGLGATLGAAVGQDSSTLQMRGLADTLPTLLEILADIAQRPSLPAPEVQLLLSTATQRQMAQLASPQFVANRQFRAELFGRHPYARVAPTPESLKAIDRAAVADFHRTHYRPNNAVLIVTGDVTMARVWPLVERAFGAWTRGDVPRPTFPAPPAVQGRRLVFVHRPGSVQSSIALGNHAVKRDDPRWFMLQLGNQIYGGAFDSRLVRNIREDKGYTYSPGSQFLAFGDAGAYRVAADVRNEVTGATLKEIYAEMDALRATPPPGDELDGAKAYARGLFVVQNATQTGLAATINTMTTYGLPRDYPETFQARMTALPAEAVSTGARMLLGTTDSLIVIVGDYTKVKDQLTGYGEVQIVDVTGKPIPPPVP